jgi:hypothetical protein
MRHFRRSLSLVRDRTEERSGEVGMASRKTNANKQRGYLGKSLLTLGVVALIADLWFLLGPLESLLGRSKEGPLGVLPELGMCLLNATHAIAFHQVSYAALISRILVLFCAMVVLIVGVAFLRPKSVRPRIQTIELVLSNEAERREMSNGSR